VSAAGIMAVLAMAEPGSRRPGVLASLRPHVAVPRQARGTFAAAAPSIVAPWALAGLYLSLGPSLAAQATGSRNLLWGGLVIFLLCGTGAAAAFVFRGMSSRAAMLAAAATGILVYRRGGIPPGQPQPHLPSRHGPSSAAVGVQAGVAHRRKSVAGRRSQSD
jgi:hypothetical protein